MKHGKNLRAGVWKLSRILTSVRSTVNSAKHCVPIPLSREYTLTWSHTQTYTFIFICMHLQLCGCMWAGAGACCSFSSHSLMCNGVMLLGDLLSLIEHLHFTVPPRMYLLKGCLEVTLFHSRDTAALWSFLHHYKWCFGKNPWACIYLQFFILQ